MSVELFVTTKSLHSFILKSHQPLFCHVAVVDDVATSDWSAAGAVAALTSTVVVADFSAFVIPEVNPVAVPVKFVATQEAGVPRAGVTSVGLVKVPFVTVGVVIVGVVIVGVLIVGVVRVLFVSV